MAYTVKNNQELMLKLSSTSLLMMAAQAKVDNYMEVHRQTFQEMMEDEEAMNLFGLYYEENNDELVSAARETLITSEEAESVMMEWLEQNEG